MRLALNPHPDSSCAAVKHIDVDVARPRGGRLVLTYVVSGTIGDLLIPPATAPSRADELWQRTCFEAFVGISGTPAYYEFNFAPSTQWAAYGFNGYRRRMRVATEISAPRVEVQTGSERLALQAALELDGISNVPSNSIWRLGLSAVIEETNGRKSYWALAHPPGKPDFHHSDCFAHELRAASRP